MMTRRTLLTRLAFTGAACLCPLRSAFASVVAPLRTSRLTIAQILPVAFPAALAELKQGRSWVSPELQRLQEQGNLMLRPLGVVVEDADGWQYEIEQLTIPMVWTRDTDIHTSEAGKISFVTTMIKDALALHDKAFLNALRGGRAVVSPTYRYQLGNVYEVPNRPISRVCIYTAVAFLHSPLLPFLKHPLTGERL